MGGFQLWTDLRVHGDWRIQQNCVTAHCRLLDNKDIRRAWGDYSQCEAELNRLLKERQVAPIPNHVVLLIHGLGGSRPLLTPLQAHLRQQGMEAMSVGYASTRYSIDEHAKSLERVIQRLGPHVTRIDFVCHSMGNIVLRRYLGQMTVGSPRQRQVGKVVMLAPPNHGAEIAQFLKDNAMFQWLAGESGQQLADFRALEKKLAVPWTPFGIIAGGGEHSINPVVEGNDDLLVGVEETKLPGAADFLVVDALHRTLPKSDQVLDATHRFLVKGFFVSEAKRNPLPPERRYRK